MKFNLKNKPTVEFNQPEEFDKWFEGFEKELRKKLSTYKDIADFEICHVLKEILGES